MTIYSTILQLGFLGTSNLIWGLNQTPPKIKSNPINLRPDRKTTN